MWRNVDVVDNELLAAYARYCCTENFKVLVFLKGGVFDLIVVNIITD